MRVRRMMAVCAMATLLGPAAVASAQDEGASEPTATWNQDRVTSYAKELSDAAAELNRALAQLPDNLDPANQRSWYRAKDDMRMLNTAARGLHRTLEKGEGKEASAPRFKRIQSLRDDAAENGRRALIPEDVFAKITPVGTAINKLAPYYR